MNWVYLNFQLMGLWNFIIVNSFFSFLYILLSKWLIEKIIRRLIIKNVFGRFAKINPCCWNLNGTFERRRSGNITFWSLKFHRNNESSHLRQCYKIILDVCGFVIKLMANRRGKQWACTLSYCNNKELESHYVELLPAPKSPWIQTSSTKFYKLISLNQFL